MNKKESVKIEDGVGKYVAEDVIVSSSYVKDDTGELVLNERTILKRGAQITSIDVATMRSNNVTDVMVSDVELTGKNEPEMKVWKCLVLYIDEGSFKVKKHKYFVIGKSPTEIENLLIEILETKIKGAFRVVSIAPFEKCRNGIIRITNDDLYEGEKILVWYNVIFFMVNDEDGQSGYEYSILVQTNEILRIREIIQGFLEKSEIEFDWEISKIVDTHAVDVIKPESTEVFSYYDL